jgi:hypothetical protein
VQTVKILSVWKGLACVQYFPSSINVAVHPLRRKGGSETVLLILVVVIVIVVMVAIDQVSDVTLARS